MVPEGALPILARVDERSGRRLARSTAIFSLATGLSRILGLVREVAGERLRMLDASGAALPASWRGLATDRERLSGHRQRATRSDPN